MPTRRLRTALFLLLAATPMVVPPAMAENPNWPPPEDATSEDLSDASYWPDDPDYAWTARRGPTGSGTTTRSSPSRTSTVRPEETASGMSIDLAWRHTIGDPRVDHRGHRQRHQLGRGRPHREGRVHQPPASSALHKPTHADGSPRAATSIRLQGLLRARPTAELTGFDCNGDGIVSVSDYAETAGLTPEASDGHPKGDRNNNGVLDAGDLILNFSDGVDDDQNGYVDDISGWDFMKNDNDPYDDTRYGHGTGEARDSVSRANNGIGSAGGCPECRFIPTRVGDSFITDVNEFGKAVVYATDNGAKVWSSARSAR
jgi:hypothetical protein